MQDIDFYDCPTYCDTANIFDGISAGDLHKLRMHVELERRIPFRPVTTAPRLPIGVAFFGLNSYCGNDFRDAYAQRNFTVWAQDRYQTKLFSVMELYLRYLKSLQGGAIYFTNLVKVVPPEHAFKTADAVERLLTESATLASLFQRLACEEVRGLVRHGCQVFVCFGDLTSSQVAKGLLASTNVRKLASDGSLTRYRFGEREFVVVKQRHFSYYRIEETIQLIRRINGGV